MLSFNQQVRALCNSSSHVHSLQCVLLSVAGNQMNEFLNENWKEAYRAVSPPIFEGFAQVVSQIINNIADFLPFDALFPETIP